MSYTKLIGVHFSETLRKKRIREPGMLKGSAAGVLEYAAHLYTKKPYHELTFDDAYASLVLDHEIVTLASLFRMKGFGPQAMMDLIALDGVEVYRIGGKDDE